MDVRLVVDKGSTKQRTWHLHHKDTVVGRRRDCDLRILSSEVSRRHCLLSIDIDSVNVEDLDSINGTFINGRRVVGKQVLHPGDHLEIGPLQFVVEYELRQRGQDQPARPDDPPEDEELGVIPLAGEDPEANAIVIAGEEEYLDVLPVLEEDSELAPDKPKKPDPGLPPAAGTTDESLAIIDEEEAAKWHLPQTNDLRDLLSQIEQPKSRPQQRER